MIKRANTLVLHRDDDVAVQLSKGVVPVGHKIARHDIKAGAFIRKYGQVIGVATADIAAGAHVHTHNLSMPETITPGAVKGAGVPRATSPRDARHSFMGYRRADGRVGTRNVIALCATVNCSATVIKLAAAELQAEGTFDDTPDVQGVAAFAHGSGCGMSRTGDGAEILERTLWGHATHPNVGAAIFVGLGCEVIEVERMRSRFGGGEAIQFLTIQDTGGTRATIDAIKARVREVVPAVAALRRSPCPISSLTIGLQCGGSDGLSGITANPALGLASDMLVAEGGSVILSETPEIFGAEHLLLSRAATPAVASALQERIDWWKAYAARHGATLDNNPSPGNKAGGLTTILEKSLGAVAKAGASPLNAVIPYAATVPTQGLVFMDSPGFDPVSATGQIASGAQIICFTTGRGSAFGSKPAPTIKIASNDYLMTHMRDDMDIGCGDILKATSLPEKAHEIFTRIVAVASGELTASERLGLGDHEFLPWQIGAVL